MHLSLSLSTFLLSFEADVCTAKKWHFYSYVLRNVCVSSTLNKQGLQDIYIGYNFEYSQFYPVPSCWFSVFHILFLFYTYKEMPIFFVVILREEVYSYHPQCV